MRFTTALEHIVSKLIPAEIPRTIFHSESAVHSSVQNLFWQVDNLIFYMKMKCQREVIEQRPGNIPCVRAIYHLSGEYTTGEVEEGEWRWEMGGGGGSKH